MNRLMHENLQREFPIESPFVEDVVTGSPVGRTDRVTHGIGLFFTTCSTLLVLDNIDDQGLVNEEACGTLSSR
jgi:hypothetical protein